MGCICMIPYVTALACINNVLVPAPVEAIRGFHLELCGWFICTLHLGCIYHISKLIYSLYNQNCCLTAFSTFFQQCFYQSNNFFCATNCIASEEVALVARYLSAISANAAIYIFPFFFHIFETNREDVWANVLNVNSRDRRPWSARAPGEARTYGRRRRRLVGSTTPDVSTGPRCASRRRTRIPPPQYPIGCSIALRQFDRTLILPQRTSLL